MTRTLLPVLLILPLFTTFGMYTLNIRMIGALDDIVSALLIVAVLVDWFVIRVRVRYPRVGNNRPEWYLFIFVFLAVVVSLPPLNPYTRVEGVAYGLFKFVRFVPLMVYAKSSLMSERDFRRYMRLFVALACIFSAVGLLQRAMGTSFYQITGYKLAGSQVGLVVRQGRHPSLFHSVNNYGNYVAGALIVVLAGLLGEDRIFKHSGVLTLFLAVALLLSGSRQATFGFILAVVFTLIALRIRISEHISKGKLVLMILAVSPAIYYAVDRLLFKLYQYSLASTAGLEFRVMSILNSIDVLTKHWVIGTGIGTWGDRSATVGGTSPLYEGYDFGLSSVTMIDTYLFHFLVENGLRALIAIAFVIAVVRLTPTTARDPIAVKPAVVGFSLLVAALSVPSMVFSNGEIMPYFWLLLGYGLRRKGILNARLARLQHVPRRS